MSTIKEAFPTFSYIYQKLASRLGKLALLLFIAIPFGTWCALRISMKMGVLRASALLFKIKELRVRESTFEDAMRLSAEYAGHVDFWDGPCNTKRCRFIIYLGQGWAEQHAFIHEILRTVGIRDYRSAGSVDVCDGRVVGTGFDLWAEAKRGAPGGQWLVVQANVTEHFPHADYSYGRQSGLEEHPNRYVRKPHLTTLGGGQILEAEVTLDATPTERERAFDFRLSCVSSLAGCAELRDLLPSAWDDYITLRDSSSRNEDKRDYEPCPLRSLARLARDMDNVLIVEIKRVFPIDRDQSSLQDVEFQLIEVLKGQTNRRLSRFPLDIGSDNDKAENLTLGLPPKIFSPGKRSVLFLRDSELDFIPYPHCEVVPATEENIRVVRQTVTQLAKHAPISALREVNRLP